MPTPIRQLSARMKALGAVHTTAARMLCSAMTGTMTARGMSAKKLPGGGHKKSR